jgi:glycosyltransferase involved in cell wall biosynthesis
MRVLTINYSDSVGGAAIAAFRLHEGLLRHGVDSRLLVGSKMTDSPLVAKIPQISWKELRLGMIGRSLGLNYVNILNTFSLDSHPYFREADLVNLHNIHSGYFNYLAIPRLTRKKPTVITLHDMWSFTGHCSYSYDCGQWRTGCAACPYPDTYPAGKKAGTGREFRLKKWVYERSNLVIVTPSRWLADQARQSMLARFPIHHIFNGIDTEVYRPLDRQLCRSALGIPREKKVLMFGAHALKDPRKNADLLARAFEHLPSALKKEMVLMTFGESGGGGGEACGMPAIDLGYIGGDRLKVIAYSAADIFLLPTRADNLPVVLQESSSCGTPMVSFDVGGVSELVRPGITGYLATPGDYRGFAGRIVELFEDDAARSRMSEHCRSIALEEYGLHAQAGAYIELYGRISAQAPPETKEV